jgi:hypothetical protein
VLLSERFSGRRIGLPRHLKNRRLYKERAAFYDRRLSMLWRCYLLLRLASSATTSIATEPPNFEFGGYRIFVPDTQHVLSEAAGMTLFMQHLAFGLITPGLTYVQAAHFVSALQSVSQSSM